MYVYTDRRSRDAALLYRHDAYRIELPMRAEAQDIYYDITYCNIVYYDMT